MLGAPVAGGQPVGLSRPSLDAAPSPDSRASEHSERLRETGTGREYIDALRRHTKPPRDVSGDDEFSPRVNFHATEYRTTIGLKQQTPLSPQLGELPIVQGKMRLLFLDESGRVDQDPLFALGGISMRDTDWPLLRDQWHETLRRNGWPLDKEVKWHGVARGTVPPPTADAIYDALATGPFTGFVALLDLRAGPELFPPEEHSFFRSPEDIYATALMFLAERYHHLLVEEDDLGLTVIDSRHREDDSRLRRFFSDLTEDGTPYVKFDRIVEGLFLAPSHFSVGLQIADLVVGATASAERGKGDGRRYLKKLLPQFAVHPATGELEGVGLKRFPEAVLRPRERHRLF